MPLFLMVRAISRSAIVPEPSSFAPGARRLLREAYINKPIPESASVCIYIPAKAATGIVVSGENT